MGFNAIAYVEELEKAGVPEKQAKAQVRLLSDIIDSDLATKKDVTELKKDIKELEARLELKIEKNLKSQEVRLIFWITVVLGAFISALKIFSL